MKLFNKTKRTDALLQRYPAAMTDLLQLGPGGDRVDYAGYAERLQDCVPDLIRLVLDDDFADLREGDPLAWAPFHALEILAILGPAAAAEPLLACLEWDTDWIDNELARAYAAIGPVAVAPLLGYLEDDVHDTMPRALAATALSAIAKAHPAVSGEIADALTRFLDRPGADASADEETVTAFVISELTDMHATGAYAAIARAYAEDRVDAHVLDLEFVERTWGMRPKIDYSVPVKRDKPGVHLVLRCKVCGRERSYVFRRVYYDIETAGDPQRRAKYDPLIIPERVVCPKCGAVDQYEPGAMAQLAVTAAVLAEEMPDQPRPLPKEQRVQIIGFSSRWGVMHPREILERYQQELARKPQSADLHIGYGNALRVLGYDDEALVEYDEAVRFEPDNVEAWLCKAQLASDAQDRREATHCWQKTYEIALRSRQVSPDYDDLVTVAQESLATLRRGEFPLGKPEAWEMARKELPPAGRPAGEPEAWEMARKELPPAGRPAAEPQAKVGRNDPCPCGSGRKYKHCHGKK